MSAAVASRLDARSTYFYLSYSHVPRTLSTPATETNHWVKIFYGDLHSAVQARAGTPAHIGFYDALLQPGSNRNERVQRELGRAEVLVPLYAPGYFSRSWSKGEWDSFLRRAATAGAAEPSRHVCAVLWVPMPADAEVPHLDRALRLGDGIDGYAEDGLQAMVRLRFHQEAYRKVVVRLADEIVRIAEDETMGPSAAPALSEVMEKIHFDTPFTVAVLAPKAGRLPRGRRPEPYGRTRVQWRPYGGADAVPIAEVASNVVEQLNLDARVADFDPTAGLFERGPGLVVVDPWFADVSPGSTEQLDALGALPSWVGIIVAVDNEDSQFESRGATLADRMRETLDGTGRPVSVANDVEEFERVLVQNILDAQKAYFRKGPVFPPDGPHDPPPWRASDHDDSHDRPGDDRR